LVFLKFPKPRFNTAHARKQIPTNQRKGASCDTGLAYPLGQVWRSSTGMPQPTGLVYHVHQQLLPLLPLPSLT
jgi:hypothetical protein